MRSWLRKDEKSSEKILGKRPLSCELEGDHDVPMTGSLSANLRTVKRYMDEESGITIRNIKLLDGQQKAAIIYINGLVDKETVQEHIIRPILAEYRSAKSLLSAPVKIDVIRESVITVLKTTESRKINECLLEIYRGNTVLMLDENSKALVIDTPAWKTRNQEEPISEPSIRGPRDSFVEALQDSILTIRRRIKDPNLVVDRHRLGRRSKTNIAVIYLRGVANQNIVDGVLRRLSRIDVDAILSVGHIESFIEDNTLSVFPQMQYTERPDRTAAAILEGRIAILVDTTPFAIILPSTFGMFFQAPDDYYDRWIYSTFIRAIRYLSIVISLFLPALYVSLISFHHGLVPTKLLIFAASTREGIPFPALVEALAMEVTIEILREAGVRLPKSIGQAVGIVGGLVIGEAAANAGIVSPVMVIIVALTAVASFSIPQYALGISMRILRFLIMLFSGMFGFFGLMLAYIMITAHMSKLKSFGVEYMSPLAPFSLKGMKDYILRAPIPTMKNRPEVLKPSDYKKAKE